LEIWLKFSGSHQKIIFHIRAAPLCEWKSEPRCYSKTLFRKTDDAADHKTNSWSLTSSLFLQLCATFKPLPSSTKCTGNLVESRCAVSILFSVSRVLSFCVSTIYELSRNFSCLRHLASSCFSCCFISQRSCWIFAILRLWSRSYQFESRNAIRWWKSCRVQLLPEGLQKESEIELLFRPRLSLRDRKHQNYFYITCDGAELGACLVPISAVSHKRF
jgi:hypothetical protein